MSTLHYPSTREYLLPKKNVLVISCIDLRLTDNLLHFLHYDNLTNRYDHFALAGTSLCACVKEGEATAELFCKNVLKKYEFFEQWQKTLDDHIAIAVALHDIRDVYIIEHEDCGAYTEFLKDGDFKNQTLEKHSHRLFAKKLSKKIHKKVYTETKKGKKCDEEAKDPGKYQLHVHSFMIDLRGNIELLHTTNKP